MQVKGPTWHKRDGGHGAGVAVGHSSDGDGLSCCRDGVLCPPFHAGGVGQWCWVPLQGHLASSWRAAMARHCQSSFSLSHQLWRLWQQGQTLPPAPGTSLVQAPLLATSGCCRVKIPQITGEGAAGSMQGAWAGEEQAALAHCGSGQAVWLPALRLCHAVSTVPEPTCLPRYPARGRGGGSGPCRRGVGTQGTSVPGDRQHPHAFWTGAPRALPARPWKGHKLHRRSIQNHGGTQGGVPRVRGIYSALFP